MDIFGFSMDRTTPGYKENPESGKIYSV